MSRDLQHRMSRALLTEAGRGRVNEALQAAVRHVEETRGLQYGMQGQHVDLARHFLEKKYKARHELQPKERDLIETLVKDHFGIKNEPNAEPTPEPKNETKPAPQQEAP